MSSDPSDIQPQASPGPSPTPTPNALSSTPSTSGVQLGGTSAAVDPGVVNTDPPQDFTIMVNTALQARLGFTKWSLIPAADKKALIAKVWQDPTIQLDYTTNHSQFTTNIGAVALLENQINQTMLGQGNDPTVAVDYTNMLQAAGVPLTTSEQAALSGATQAVNAPVPRPFGASVVSGYDFGAPMPAGGWSSKNPGQSFGWDKHNGVDYGTRAGERIVTPFAGTATVQTNVPGYGNYVTITLDNGWKMGFGHVASGAVTNGERVNPGDLIAIAGANVGSAQGAVTIVTWQDPKGNYVNPHDVLDPVFAGATFSSLGAPGAAGTGMPTVNKVLDTEYPSIKNDWQSMFGTPPSPEDVYNVLQHGSSPAQWLDYIRALPSHIGGLNQGQYHDMRQVADDVSTKVLGHPSTDGIVAELSQQGLSGQKAVENWYNEHGVTGVPPDDYNKIYKATQPTMGAIFNEPAGADPRDIRNIYNLQDKTRQTGGQAT